MLKRNPQHFWRQMKQSPADPVERPGKSALKKAKTVSSAGNVMATVFWDSQGIIFTDYLQKGEIITGASYATLLTCLNEELRMKQPRLARKKSSSTITTHQLTPLQSQ